VAVEKERERWKCESEWEGLMGLGLGDDDEMEVVIRLGGICGVMKRRKASPSATICMRMYE
jgi:hypothetical protein